MSHNLNQANFAATADNTNSTTNNNSSSTNNQTGWTSTANEKVLVHLDRFDPVTYIAKIPGVATTANKLPTTVKKVIRRVLLVIDLRVASEQYVPTEEDTKNDNKNNNNNSNSSNNNNSSSNNNSTSGNNNTVSAKYTTTGPGSYSQ